MKIINQELDLINEQINEINNHMKDDLNEIRKNLNSFVSSKIIYGYEFTRLGGVNNFGLSIYPKSRFKDVKLGIKSIPDNFDLLPDSVKNLSSELNLYMTIIKQNTLLSKTFIELHPFNDIITNNIINKTFLKNNKIKP